MRADLFVDSQQSKIRIVSHVTVKGAKFFVMECDGIRIYTGKFDAEAAAWARELAYDLLHAAKEVERGHDTAWATDIAGSPVVAQDANEVVL